MSTRTLEPLAQRPVPVLDSDDNWITAKVLESEVWKVEVGYDTRGLFQVKETPYLIQPLDPDHLQIVFPIEVDCIEGGTQTALAATYRVPTARGIYCHCLS